MFFLHTPFGLSIDDKCWPSRPEEININRSDYNNNRILMMRVLSNHDPVAMSALYYKYRELLEKYLFYLTGSHSDTMDLVAELFARIWQGQCKYNGESDVQAYLLGIAKNVARRHRSRELRRNTAHANFRNHCIGARIAGLADSTYNPERIIQIREIHEKTLKALKRLPEKSREALELVLIHGIRPCDAATQLGCPFPIFRNRMQYGLAKLRQELDDIDFLF